MNPNLRALRCVALASLLGLSAAAFSASPPDANTGTRDERMAQALSDFRQAQTASSVLPGASTEPLKSKHGPKHHHPMKHRDEVARPK